MPVGRAVIGVVDAPVERAEAIVSVSYCHKLKSVLTCRKVGDSQTVGWEYDAPHLLAVKNYVNER